MARIWYCSNCGYEVRGRGRCHSCREKLTASDLRELEAGDEEDEVGYRLGGWQDRDRGRLIEFLNSLQIVHRFEEEELVVAADDEERVDDLVAELMATASADDDAVDEDDDFDASYFDDVEPATLDQNVAETVALLADAARRLRTDPTDMQADADVAQASTVVFLADTFQGFSEESWAAVGRVTRRLLSALGAEEALEEEIRLQAGVLAKLLDEGAGPLSVPEAVPGSGVAPNEELQAAGSPVANRLAVGTVYELTDWTPEQRAHLSVLLDDNKISHGWDADDLVVDSAREAETEALFSLVGGSGPGEDQEDDEDRYHAIEELFNASGRLASSPDDLERRADAVAWAEEVEGPTPVGVDGVFWLRVVKSIHSLVAAVDADEADDDVIADEAGALHDLLRTIV